MVVSPLDGRLYITDQQNLRIIRVKTMGAVRELTQNFEVVAGTGQQCVPGDPDQCGDGAPATGARLFYPKGKDSGPAAARPAIAEVLTRTLALTLRSLRWRAACTKGDSCYFLSWHIVKKMEQFF